MSEGRQFDLGPAQAGGACRQIMDFQCARRRRSERFSRRNVSIALRHFFSTGTVVFSRQGSVDQNLIHIW